MLVLMIHLRKAKPDRENGNGFHMLVLMIPASKYDWDSICCLLFFHRESIVHLLVRSNIFEKIKLM